MPRCQSRFALAPALLLAGVLASLATPPTPCRADDILWSHLNPLGSPATTTGGWVVFDSRRGRFLHGPGSYNTDARYCFGNIYIYADSTYAVSPDGFRWNVLSSAGSHPGRADASAVYDSLGDRVIVFGGTSGGYVCINGGGYDVPVIHYNDVWVLAADGSAPWTELAVAGTGPSPRSDGSMVLDTKRNRLLVFGGGELWELSLNGPPAWRQIVTSQGPSKRFGHAAIYDPRRDRMVIACGVDSALQYLADTWAYDPGSESWTNLAPGGPSPNGPTAGSYDAAGDQMVSVSISENYDLPVRVRTLGLGPGGTWNTPSVAGLADFWFGTYPRRVAAAMSDTRALLVLWAAGIGHSVAYGGFRSDASVARFQPIQKLAIAFTDPTVVYTVPNPSLLWHTQMNRPPYEAVRFRNTTTGFEATAYPDSSGTFLIYEQPLTPGIRYAYHVNWFDGYAERDTGEFFIDTPPYPVDIGFAFGSPSIQGRDILVRIGATDDSTLMSTQFIERRFPPADWQPVWSGHIVSEVSFVEPSVPPGALVEFRGMWGNPAAPIYSAPIQVRMDPDPVFRSLAWTQGVVDLRYTIEPGSAFVGGIYRYPLPEPQPVLVGQTVAAPDGSIHFQDAAVPLQTSPVQFVYYLEWNVGGVPLRDEDRFVMVPAIAPVSILGLTNPARDQISFSVEVRDAGPCRAEVYDVNGRRIWQETFGGPGTHPVTLRGPAGLYFVRLVHRHLTESKRVVLIQ